MGRVGIPKAESSQSRCSDYGADVVAQMNTSTFMGPRLNDPNGQWLSDPNAALYISNSASGSGKDAVVIITLTNPVFNNVTNVATYKVQATWLRSCSVSSNEKSGQSVIKQCNAEKLVWCCRVNRTDV